MWVLPCFLSMRPVLSRCLPSSPFLAVFLTAFFAAFLAIKLSPDVVVQEAYHERRKACSRRLSLLTIGTRMSSVFETSPSAAAIPITFVTKATWEAIRNGLPTEAQQFALAN